MNILIADDDRVLTQVLSVRLNSWPSLRISSDWKPSSRLCCALSRFEARANHCSTSARQLPGRKH
jgi:hypothetical protein